jgi:asparagine synthase (glutamine-hydrolysing)
MSAIAGFWRFNGRPDAEACTARILAALSTFGPHNSSHWSDETIALGRRLFRTLPEDAWDRGPAIGAGGNLVLVGDVRLDNRDELTDLLGITADRARTVCDVEILLFAFERWEEAVVDRLSGDFAFAAWDKARRRLVLARDFLGQRPLHFHRGADYFAFASMPKGLHALPGIPLAPDEERLAEFLTLMPESGSRSFFAGIERVEAGHIVTVTTSGVSTRRYWHPSRKNLVLKHSDDYVEGVRHHLDEAVRARLRGANGQVGAHLSAGFDSSAVAATAARILAPVGGRVTAFTSVPRNDYDRPAPKGRIGDEGPLAAATAAMHCNIEHVLIKGQSRSPFESLDRSFFLYERPMLNLCNGVWIDAISDAARERKLMVVLNGQMGNMSLSYSGVELLPELFVAKRWRDLLDEARELVRSHEMRWRGVAAATFGPFISPALWRWLSRTFRGIDQDVRRYTAVNDELLTSLDLPERARRSDLDFSYRPWRDGFSMRLWVLRRVDMGNYNKGVLGGWGIDQRDPTADRHLIEFCLSVPTEQFLSRGVTRSLARRALSDRLPDVVLGERRKGLQAVDWHEGLTAARGQAAEEIERLASCQPAATMLDLPRLRALVEDWPTGGWEGEAIVQRYRLALLRGISIGHFLRKATGANQ